MSMLYLGNKPIGAISRVTMPASSVTYGSGTVEDALDGFEWKHKSVSLSPTSISTNFTETNVPEIVGATEIIAIVGGGDCIYIKGVANMSMCGSLTTLIGNTNWQTACDVSANVTTGVVGIRCSLKGASSNYPTLTDLYYR